MKTSDRNPSVFRDAADNAAQRREVLWLLVWGTIIILMTSAAIILTSSCSPLIQTGGSVSVSTLGSRAPMTNGAPQTARQSTDNAVTVIAHGGQLVRSGDRADVNATASNTETQPPSRWRFAVWGIIALVVGAIGIIWLVTHSKIIQSAASVFTKGLLPPP